MRDEKIPIISFVANTGGLLGLCMGFSLVSVFEIMFHCGGAVKKEFLRRQKHQKSRNTDKSEHTVVFSRANRDTSEQNENCLIDEEIANNEEIHVAPSDTSPVSTPKSNVKFRKTSHNSLLR